MRKTSSNSYFPVHFKDFILLLNEMKVEYLLIRGYAMGAYGHIRATSDLDIFLNATEDNADKMIAACEKYGIPAEELNRDMFLIPRMIGIGEPPLRIEILKQLGVVDFNFAYQRVTTKEVNGLTINVISLDDLILLKKSDIDGRSSSRDQEDLSFLEKLKLSLGKS